MQRDSKNVTAPIAKSKTVRGSRPEIKTMSNGDCLIHHREYIMDIIAGAGTPSPYTVQQLPINPGQVGTFQWLSRVASNYESYVFQSLKFSYETEAPTTLGGTLVMTVDYDASDPSPITKQQAMAYRSSIRSAPWTACSHVSLREDLSKSKTNFVRIGAQPPNTDIKTYDIGNLFVISQGVTTTGATLGELYVEYSVLLMTPVFENVTSLVPVGGLANGTGVLTAANPFGNGVGQSVPPSFGFSLNSLSVFSFPTTGTYLMAFTLEGTNITGDDLTPGSVNQVVNQLDITALAAGTSAASIWSVYVIEPGTVAYTATATTVTQAVAYIGTAPTGSL